MADIPLCALMDLFVDTLEKCGVHLLEMNDEILGYYIFEEFDTGATSFLHESTLSKLRTANFINESVCRKSTELRRKLMRLQNTNQWNVDAVRTTKEWREILGLSDEIKSMLWNN